LPSKHPVQDTQMLKKAPKVIISRIPYPSNRRDTHDF
jgi:hypothetical protein